MATRADVVASFDVLAAKPYYRSIGYTADGDTGDGDEPVVLTLSKQDAARAVVSLMTIAVEFDKEGIYDGAVESLVVATVIGDQALTEITETAEA